MSHEHNNAELEKVRALVTFRGRLVPLEEGNQFQNMPTPTDPTSPDAQQQTILMTTEQNTVGLENLI